MFADLTVRIIRPRMLIGLAMLAFSACVPRAPEPRPAPAPAALPQPEPTAPILTELPTPTYRTWMDAPQTPGDWTYQGQGPASVTSSAQFAGDGAVRLAVTCLRENGVVRLQQLTASAIPAAGTTMTIRTEFGDRTFAVQAIEGRPYIELPASDPFLEAIAFSKGRFAVEMVGAPALYLPAWPEITRVIEDCRRGPL